MSEEPQDVKSEAPEVPDVEQTVDSSPQEARVEDPELLIINDESQDSEEPKVEVEDESTKEVQAEEVREAKPHEPKIPYPRLKKEIDKRKDLEEKVEELSRLIGKTNESKAIQEPIRDDGPLKKPTAPSLKDFDYDESKFASAQIDYIEKLTDYKLDLKDLERKQMKEKEASQKKTEIAKSKIEAFYNKNEDYQRVVAEVVENGEDVSYPDSVNIALRDLEEGPEIDLYILQNRNEILPKLRSMSPEMQFMEIGRIQASLPKNDATKVQKKSTQAPKVIESNSGSARAIPDEIDGLVIL